MVKKDIPVRNRIQFDLTEAEIAAFDQATQDSTSPSRAEFIRRCVRFFIGVILPATKRGARIIIREDGQPDREIVLFV